MNREHRIVIIGSGMGGATLAAGLAPSGVPILILERGERLKDCAEARDATAIFRHGRFLPDETWLDGAGARFNPGNYYCVGGNSKFYGAVLIRYRAEDFDPISHLGGTTSGWPLDYRDMERWYQAAEEMYRVRGALGEDPHEPQHSGGYPFPPVADEPAIADFRRRLKKIGLHPSSLPLAVDLERWLARAATPWDAFPDTLSGKMDAESIGIALALAHPNVELVTNARAQRLNAGPDGRIKSVTYMHDGIAEEVQAPLFALAAGAVHSAALLLGSTDETRPNGLANGSGQVGRNFMNHNCSAILAIHPLRRNGAVYQKTLHIGDFYLGGGPRGKPLGSVQLLGKVSGPILASQTRLPLSVANWVANHSVDLYAISEDLPNPKSRISLSNGRIVLDWRRSNWNTHLALVARLKKMLRKAGYPIVLSRPFDRRTPSHQCGTARMGDDPRTSVVDSNCRSHDHPNLFITDASVLPTSAAVNPALSIAALALRCAGHIETAEIRT